MQKCYEFKDSLLESLDQDADRVTINLRAVRSEVERSAAEMPPNLFRQEIRLVLDGAELAVDSPNLPSWLMEGTFSADSLDADCADCTDENTIPVSLRSASGVELTLAGLHEGSGDFVTIRARAKSFALQPLAEPQSLQHTRATI
ncbi:MAG TPA: hypothetical protein VGL22_06475 [Terracidiphilus sp.]|jgi:hypothetical protein